MPDWRWLHRMTLRLRTLFQRNRVERELEEEFQFHIERRIELEIARGLSPEDARSAILDVQDWHDQSASFEAMAYYSSREAAVALAPADLPRLGETAIDRWVLAFTLGISMITSLLFGLVPALNASKVDVSDALKQGPHAWWVAAGPHAWRARGRRARAGR